MGTWWQSLIAEYASYVYIAYALYALALCAGTALLLMRHTFPMLAPFRCCVCSIERAPIVYADKLDRASPTNLMFETNQYNKPVRVLMCVYVT